MVKAQSVENLYRLGTSVWYDNISRDLLENGELKRLVEEWGVRGLTSNPTIFENAVRSSSVYDEAIQREKAKGLSTAEIFEELALEDISRAADLLRPVYDETKGEDGYVSIEVSPLLARDTAGTVDEARRLFSRLNKPNIMIKVPGTQEGLPAVRTLLEEGINVNITLLFSVENYEQVARTYIEALTARKQEGEPVDAVRSVASFFVSRVDSAVDGELDAFASEHAGKADEAAALKCVAGIANSRLAYQSFEKIFRGEEFAELAKAGAPVQRPLWASTGTKNPEYSDVLYVETLAGADTVNTLPHATLAAFVDHGNAERDTLHDNEEETASFISRLQAFDVDFAKVLHELQVDGVKKFSDSFTTLLSAIEEKMG